MKKHMRNRTEIIFAIAAAMILSGCSGSTETIEDTVNTSSTETESVETVSAETESAESEEMPEPFDTNGGDEHSAFYQPCGGILDTIPAELMNLVDGDELTAYIDSFSTLMVAPDSISDYANIYSFVKHFDISKEDARSALAYFLESDDEQIKITNEQLDIIFSDDVELITENFASNYSIVVGEHIYNPFWVYTHSTSDYEVAGITAEDILSKAELYSEMSLSSDAAAAFESKLSDYTDTAVVIAASTESIAAEDTLTITTIAEDTLIIAADDGSIEIIEE